MAPDRPSGDAVETVVGNGVVRGSLGVDLTLIGVGVMDERHRGTTDFEPSHWLLRRSGRPITQERQD